jgi:hypothetical protein
MPLFGVVMTKQHTQFVNLSPIKTRIPLHTQQSFLQFYDLNMRLTKLLARLVAKLLDPKAPPAKLLA